LYVTGISSSQTMVCNGDFLESNHGM